MADRDYVTLRTARGTVDVHKDFLRMFAHEMGTLIERRELFDNDMQYVMYLESQRPKLYGWQPK
jgi:hypothetical protein